LGRKKKQGGGGRRGIAKKKPQGEGRTGLLTNKVGGADAEVRKQGNFPGGDYLYKGREKLVWT